MKSGALEIFAPNTGMFKLDGGAMFGSVPKTLWEKAIPPDEFNRIPMALRILVVKDSATKRNFLIDTGIGHKWTEKLEKIYAIDHSKDTLDQALKACGLSKVDITDVILTHLHFDHAGGATEFDAQKRIVPTFPNATFYIQKDNFDWATRPNSREVASYLAENFQPLVDAKKLVVCDGVEGFENAIKHPAFSVRLSYGHTIGLQCPLITIGDQKFFYPSDLIPTSSHIPVPWVMGYDIHVIKILDEKEEILKEALRDNWIMVYEHDPLIPATRVAKGAKHFERTAPVDV